MHIDFLYNFEEILRLLRMWYSFVERSSRKGCFYFLLAVAEVQGVAWCEFSDDAAVCGGYS